MAEGGSGFRAHNTRNERNWRKINAKSKGKTHGHPKRNAELQHRRDDDRYSTFQGRGAFEEYGQQPDQQHHGNLEYAKSKGKMISPHGHSKRNAELQHRRDDDRYSTFQGRAAFEEYGQQPDEQHHGNFEHGICIGKYRPTHGNPDCSSQQPFRHYEPHSSFPETAASVGYASPNMQITYQSGHQFYQFHSDTVFMNAGGLEWKYIEGTSFFATESFNMEASRNSSTLNTSSVITPSYLHAAPRNVDNSIQSSVTFPTVSFYDDVFNLQMQNQFIQMGLTAPPNTPSPKEEDKFRNEDGIAYLRRSFT